MCIRDRIHVQTLCALDHLDFNLPDTHSYAQYLDVVDRLGLGPTALEQAFRRVAFNVAAVNRDDHTKNLSFRCDEAGGWSLAPAYDVNHAYNPHGRWTQRHQMSVNGKFEGIGRSDLLELADRFLVPSPARVLAGVLDAVGSWPTFAREAGVPGPDIERIGAEMCIRDSLRRVPPGRLVATPHLVRDDRRGDHLLVVGAGLSLIHI